MSFTRAASIPGPVRALAQRQDGVVSRAQLRSAAISRSVVAAQVRARRWRLVGRAVVLHRGGLTADQRRWAVVLDHAEGSVALASFTALEVHGLRGWTRDDVHVVVRKSARTRHLPGVVVHESRRFDPRSDVVRVRGLPVTGPARSAVDAAAWSRSPRTAAAVVLATIQQRLTTADAVGAALAAAGRVRHASLLRRTVADAAGGADSLAELDLGRLIRRAGLPSPTRQAVRLGADGRRRYVDVVTTLPDGTPLEIEVDGSIHLDVERWWADQRRHNETARPGVLRLRVPAVAVRTDPDDVVAQLRRLRVRHAA